MVLLHPGSFRVSDYRKSIPAKVKLTVMARDYDVDHDPALAFRPYDTEAEDFVPPQHSVDHLVLRTRAEHREKTFGRKPGAMRTSTTRGSDIGEAAHERAVKARQAVHAAKLASKDGDFKRSAEILSSVPKSRRKPKKAWQSRPFPKGRGFGKRKGAG